MTTRLRSAHERGVILLIGAAVLASGILVLLPQPFSKVELAAGPIPLGGVRIVLPRFEEEPPIDLNTAGVEELILLPGIGPVLARRILTDRVENGPLGSLEELQRVQGVGPQTIQGIRESGRAVVTRP